eukprot:GFYU01005537.1.p1 GENE.GFYU01005537.1~~GFYU01005537.1.p1  ORF type:complete len:147 (-),score=61.93 GFYU01005537.1:403-843(-)
MGKTPKKDKADKEEGEDKEYYVAPIANPLAGKKLTKKTLKLVKKAAKAKAVRRGVKEVQKALRKGEKGVCILAGNISPIDVITHLPIMCEEGGIPYVYVPSKEELGTAGQTKRPTSCVLVTGTSSDYKEELDEVKKGVKEITPLFT